MKKIFCSANLFTDSRWDLWQQHSIFDATSQPLLKELLTDQMLDFKVGDTVCLITSPQDVMTVCSVFGQRLVECTWVGKEGKTYKHSFRPESLRLVTSDESQNYSQDESTLKIDFSDEDDDFNF